MKSAMNAKDIAKNALESTLEKMEDHNAMIHERMYSEMSEELAAIAEMNGGVPPTVDRLFRLHAPYDGYELDDGKRYLKGQFIQSRDISDIVENFMLDMYGYKRDKNNSQRLLVNKDVADEVFAIAYDNGIISVSMGRAFKNGDTESCYLYVEGPKFLVNHFLKQIKDLSTDIKKLSGTAPEGRVEVVGTITSMRDHFDPVYNTYSKKVRIVLNNDSSCYGNLQKALYDRVKVGDEIKFTATFKASDDASHAYLSRMARASVTRVAEEIELEQVLVEA